MHYYFQNNDIIRVIDRDSPNLDKPLDNCKGELMDHQNRVIRAVIDTERADHIIANDGFNDIIIRTNHLRIEMKMGSGKTELAIGIVLAERRPIKKPVYSCVQNIPTTTVFNDDRVIDPTFIVVHHSIYFQWADRIDKFSNLRTFRICDSRSLVKFTKMIHDDLSLFNSSYDIVLVNTKTVAGNVSYALHKCEYILSQAVNKSRRIYSVLFNMLANFYIRRIIYDDWDMLGLGIVPIERAGSCIRMSATKKTCGSNNINPFINKDNFHSYLHAPCYAFCDKIAIGKIPCINVEDNYLRESIELGLPSSHINMMPAVPEVYIYTIKNAENAAINIISELSTDEKILESVNSLSNTSPCHIIKSLFKDKYHEYTAAQKIIAHYAAIDLNELAKLPEPPEGSSFQRADIEKCSPIKYKYRAIVDRINECVADANEIIKRETIILDRIRDSIKKNCCGICLDDIDNSPAAIMLCCSNIMHVKCVLMCRNKRCPYCRETYGRTFDDTFVCLHHDTDIQSLLNTSINEGMETDDGYFCNQTKITKMSIAREIIMGMQPSVDKTPIQLMPLQSIIFDEKSAAKCVDGPRKVLIYCSADETIDKISSSITGSIDHSKLTASSTSTYDKIKHFRDATVDTAILANSWTDAAGIDFNMASDTIVFNYFKSPQIINQMWGRTLRMGQKYRSRIHIIAYENEKTQWFDNYVKSAASSN